MRRALLPICSLVLLESACAAGGASSPELGVWFDGLEEGDTLQGAVDLRVGFAPADPSVLTLYMDDAPVARADSPTESPATLRWDTQTVPDGLHTLRIEARWPSGAASAARRIVVANAGRGLRIVEPVEQLFREDESFLLALEVDPSIGLSWIEVRDAGGRLLQRVEPVLRTSLALRILTEELELTEEQEEVTLRAEAMGTDGLVRADQRTWPLRSRRLWRFDTLGPVWTQPEALPDGAVAVLTSSAVLHIVEPDGSERCRVRADGENGDGVPRFVEGAGAVAWGSSRAFRITDVTDCTERYRDPLDASFPARPLVTSDGTLVVVAHDGTLLRMAPDGSGRRVLDLAAQVMGGATLEVWSAPVQGRDGTVFVAGVLGRGGVLFAIAPDDAIREVPLTSAVRGDLLLHGDTLYFTGSDGVTYAYDTGLNRRWLAPGLDSAPLQAHPVLVDGALVTTDGGGIVIGLDPASREERWRYDATQERIGSIDIIGSAGFSTDPEASTWIALGDALGTLHLLEGGALRFRILLTSGRMGEGIAARPEVTDERVYVGTETQTLEAFRLR